MKKISLFFVFIFGISFILGSANKSYKIGKDIYTITDYAPIAMRVANETCQEQGLFLKLLRQRNVGNNDIAIDFKCLDENSPEYKNSDYYEVGADVNINVDKKIQYK